MSVEDKINAVATKVYGAAGVEYTDAAKASLAKIKELGKDKLPVCIAKTQYSFSDDMKLLGRPTGFTMTVRDIEIRGGAGFLVVVCGSITERIEYDNRFAKRRDKGVVLKTPKKHCKLLSQKSLQFQKRKQTSGMIVSYQLPIKEVYGRDQVNEFY